MLDASPDLTELARAQVALLVQTLGAMSCVMYVTETLAGQGSPQLIEVVAYPEDGSDRRLDTAAALVLPPAESADSNVPAKQGRLVLPLMHDNDILGFLMVGRDDRDWSAGERGQIQQVANTLAIACALDRRCQWLEASQRAAQEQIHAQQREFLATLLHQLRNPLTALRTFSQLLLRRILPDDPNRKLASNILREALHLQDLLATADAARSPERPTEALDASPERLLLPVTAVTLASVDLHAVLEPLCEAASAIADERGLQFACHWPEVMPLALADASLLREIVSNLLDNALKYTPEGGRVDVMTDALGDRVAILIRDTGVGIPPEDRTQLFERHFRGRQASGQIQGTGLGLAIARDLTRRMGGEILVESVVNEGTTFAVLLQRGDRELTPLPATSAGNEP